MRRLSRAMTVGVKADVEAWPIAMDRVRYVGEPVAVIVAADRYLAEDAADLVEVEYATLPATVDPLAAAEPDGPVLHPSLGGNVINERVFSYGEPKSAFESAPRRVAVSV